MKKRVLSLIAVLGLLVSMICVPVTAVEEAAVNTAPAATADQDSMLVGYSKMDINPYVYHYVDENREGEVPVQIFTDENGREYYTNWNRDASGATEYELMPVPLRGFRESMERLSLTYKMDDNGDGIVNEEDGLWGTCIVMTAPDGSTLITISLDMIGVDEGSRLDAIRQAIREATGVPEDHIMVQGTHTHFAADFSNITTAMSTSTTEYIRYDDGKYFTGAEIYNYLVKYRDDMTRIIADAAARAMADRAPAVMEKGAIDTSEAENCPEGYRMNVVRHYAMTRQKILKIGGNYVQVDGQYIADPNGAIANYVAGDNFNGGGDPVGARYGSWVITAAQSVAESNDLLYAVRYTFPGTDKEPIALINWRAHPCNNRNISGDAETNGWPNATSYYQVSGDYVNAFRKELEKSGVRVSFHQGASGNINTGDATLANAWTEKIGTDKGNIYGSTLGKIALELVGENGTGLEEIRGGSVRVSHMVYHDPGNTNSPAMLAAAKLFEEYYEGPIPLEGEGYRVVDTNGSGYGETGERVIDTNTGAYVTIASRYHANAVLSREKVKGKVAYGRVEIGAVTVGDDLAFVNAPGELYDRYDAEGSVLDSTTTGWASLVDESTYGTPFVLGYCNGTRGYFPNVAAYSYNYGATDSKGNLTNDAVGSYESQTTRLAPGGGEKLISIWRELLAHIKDEDTGLPEKCEHCGVEVVWSPWNQANAADIDDVSSGHYYLTEDVTGCVKTIPSGRKVCMYLNGHTFTGTTRGFTVQPYGELSIHGEGTIQGKDMTQASAVCVQGNAKCSLYGGTLTMAPDPAQVPKQGGVLYILGGAEFNQYGGTVTGGTSYFYGGNVLLAGNYNMYGGSITNGTVCTNGSGGNGGNVFVSGTGVFTMYNGTVSGGSTVVGSPELSDKPNGGNVYVEGKMVVHGGTVTGGHSFWAGGDIYVNGKLEMTGGTVTGGTTDTVSKSVHVSKTGSVRLSGDAKVDQIRTARADFLTVSGKFTGKTALAFQSVSAAEGVVLGVSENAVFTPENISVTTKLALVPSAGSLVLTEKGVARLSDNDKLYDTLSQAVAAAENTDAYVILQKDAVETLSSDGTVNVDLNGFDITGGVYTRGEGAIFLRDSKTDDFTVADGVYGKLTGTVSGNVQAAEGYFPVEQADGKSFHRTVTELTHVSLRPSETGIYFTGDFRTDETVQSVVKRFGIALNAYTAPSAENIESTTIYTSLTDWAGESHSVLLTGILKAENDAQTNWCNGATRVFACTYLQTDTGYVFGDVVCISLQELTELVSDSWTSLNDFQQGSLLDMYGTWWDVMDYWNIPEIKNAW